MNSDEQFESRLQREPLRDAPLPWRQEILAKARAAAPGHAARFTQHAAWWRELFWPHPAAWAALAGVWLVMLGVHFVSREATPPVFARQVAPSREMRELLKQQEQLFAELVGPRENRDAVRPKPAGPQPRSLRREETLNA